MLITPDFEVTHYEPSQDSMESVWPIVKEAYQKNLEFFAGVAVPIKVHLVYNREEMDSLLGRKTQDWVVGIFKPSKKEIYVFAPSVYERESSHKVDDFPYTIAHEMAHIFTADLYGLKDPKWLREGLAGYVAKDFEVFKMKKSKASDLKSQHTSEQWEEGHNYPQAFSFTKYLIERCGKNDFLKFYQVLGSEDPYKEFCRKFHDFFGYSLEDCEKGWRESLDDRSDSFQ